MSETTRFFATKAEAATHGGPAIVVPCLNATTRVSHIIGELRQFASTAEAISVWRPIHAWVGLRQIRNELAAIRASHDTVLSEWFARLAEPVEGGTGMQLAAECHSL